MKCSTDHSSKKRGLSARREQILRGQEITRTKPGSILHDFAAMLQCMQANDVRLSTTGLLPMKLLRPVNEMMHQPLEVGLTRPHLKSFPNIEGLFMLLRASGLVRVEQTGKKRFLRMDESMMVSWERLTDVEQYIHLLRVWLLWADPSVVHSNDPSRCPILPECIDFVTGLTKLLNRYPGDVIDYLRYRPGHFNVALAELFGLVAIKQRTARNGQGWAISRIKTTPFGQALCTLLVRIVAEGNGYLPEEDTFEHWQQCLAPYFPELQAELSVPEMEIVEGVHIITVSLGESWRQLAVPHTCSLELLTGTILNVFKFDHDHLYVFEVEDRFGSVQEITHPYMDESPHTDEVAIGGLSLQPGQHLRFRYDFGENWQFEIAIDRIDPTDRKMRRPKLLKEHGEAPRQYECADDWE